jgi:hypothetical protein
MMTILCCFKMLATIDQNWSRFSGSRNFKGSSKMMTGGSPMKQHANASLCLALTEKYSQCPDASCFNPLKNGSIVIKTHSCVTMKGMLN